VARPRVTVSGGTTNYQKLDIPKDGAKNEGHACPILPEDSAPVLAL